MSCELQRLHARAALPIDGRAGRRFGQPSIQPCVAGDVQRLLPDLIDTPGDEVLNLRRVDFRLLKEPLQGEAKQLDRVPAAELPSAAAERCAQAADDDRLAASIR